jgi:hypothetical protein
MVKTCSSSHAFLATDLLTTTFTAILAGLSMAFFQLIPTSQDTNRSLVWKNPRAIQRRTYIATHYIYAAHTRPAIEMILQLAIAFS